jgi:hypothetical protein
MTWETTQKIGNYGIPLQSFSRRLKEPRVQNCQELLRNPVIGIKIGELSPASSFSCLISEIRNRESIISNAGGYVVGNGV